VRSGVTLDLENVTPAQMLKLMSEGTGITASGWFLSREEVSSGCATHFWITSPYGIDCGYVPLTEEGCARIRTMILTHVDQGELEHF
jgi:hypothetical protein